MGISSRLVCAFLSAFTMLFLTGWVSKEAPWLLGRAQLFSGVLFSGAVAASILIAYVLLLALRKQNFSYVFRLFLSLGVGCLFLIPVLVVIVFFADGIDGLGIPPFVLMKQSLLVMVASYVALVFINSLPINAIPAFLLNLTALAFSVYGVTSIASVAQLRVIVKGDAVLFDDSETFLFSSLHDVKLVNHEIYASARPRQGGGIDVVDDSHLLLVTGDGEIRVIRTDGDDLIVDPSIMHTPFDPSSYNENNSNPSAYFRVTDSHLDPGSSHLYVSYHYWNSKDSCLALKVSRTSFDLATFGLSRFQWEEVFQSSPCLKRPLYNGTGGRMAMLDADTLLVTVGDTVTGWDASALDASDYGKVLAVDLINNNVEVFSKGHRNSQGLVVLADGSVWATEHGPHGGDELNKLSKGGDYGWPRATYGTDYGKKSWPLEPVPGGHSSGLTPIFSWVPSIGISSLIQIKGDTFNSWKGDFIVSSLYGRNYGKSLFRVKVVDGRAVVNERINVGYPVRDLVEMGDGRIALWDGRNVIQILQPATLLFSTCSGCHAMRWRSHGIGPDLMGVVGEDVARHKEFQYSDALKNFGGVWTRDRLDNFLENPSLAVPGTSMNFSGISDPERRAELIDYLSKIQLPEN